MIREIEELESANPYQKSIEFYNDNDEVIGYLVYSLIYNRIEVDDFFVKENHRNKGIGTKIMSYLICIAINNHELMLIYIEFNEHFCMNFLRI